MKSKLKLFGKINGSIVDGTGFRYVIFTQGCPHNCKGCHNPESHDFNEGAEYEIQVLLEEIKANPMLSGLTLSGGEPLAHAEKLLPLAQEVRNLGLNIWIYTGYTFDELLKLPQNSPEIKLLKLSQVLIDGPFILEQRSLELTFRGSYNQRIIDLEESFATGIMALKSID
ncbi:MAG: anaerobic ribonucleoside-triphosphate reductase activating protein [Filifactoraceae bacterium]